MASQFGKPKAKSSDPTATEDPEDVRLTNGANTYQIGTEIGRGGYAVVYAAFNVNNGSSVAVKRFPLDAIDAESLGNIEAEIELMKNLNHPNIVKYVDTIRTKAYLHIVLE
jgi:serine/threonine protein kinase